MTAGAAGVVAAAGATVAARVHCRGVSSGGDGGAGGGSCGEAGVPRRQGRRRRLWAVTVELEVAAVTAPSEETSPAAAGTHQRQGGISSTAVQLTVAAGGAAMAAGGAARAPAAA